MGTSESDAPPKAPKTSGAQEQPPATSSSPTTTMYPDWSGFQAYSPIPPHGFFHSPVASSPQAHPYMWGAQHLMPPFGTPPPPYVMYPHGGLYAHPSIPPGSHPFGPYAVPSTNGNPEASGAVTTGMEGDGKSSEGKERSPIKRSKGSLGSLNMITGKNNDLSKTSGAANGVFSQSSESGSEGSSDGSDVNSQNDERELKRQKRKQSNRESARRSRLRKQAECEELARRVEALKEENTALRAEVDRMRKDYEQLLAQNAFLKEKLGEPTKGSEDAKLDENNQDSVDDTQKHSDSIVKAGQPDSAPSGC